MLFLTWSCFSPHTLSLSYLAFGLVFSFTSIWVLRVVRMFGVDKKALNCREEKEEDERGERVEWKLKEKQEKRAKNSFEATPGWGQRTQKTEKWKLLHFCPETFLLSNVVAVIFVVVAESVSILLHYCFKIITLNNKFVNCVFRIKSSEIIKGSQQITLLQLIYVLILNTIWVNCKLNNKVIGVPMESSVRENPSIYLEEGISIVWLAF